MCMLKINEKLIPTNWNKLWENSNPTSNFAAQTINFDATNYDYFIIIYKNSASGTIHSSKTIIKNVRFSLNGVNAGKLFVRNTDTSGITDTGVTFQSGLNINTYGSETTSNDVAVPYQIYGGKF